MKLDAKTVAALKLDGKTDMICFDDAMHGFGYRLRLGSGGKIMRSWICQYRRAGASRRVLLGNADIVSAEQARAAAKKLLAKVALGEDPQAERIDRRGKDALTMRSQVAEFLAVKESELAPRTYVETKRYLTDPKYFGPLHRLPIDGISRKDIAARTVAIVRERGSPTAARARGALGAFFTWCMRMGLAESNPTIGSVAPAASSGRDRVLTGDEITRIWRACRDDDHGRIIRLLILSACRRAEVGDMGWSELDFERGTFTIPAARAKTDKPHTLPLLPMMLQIINAVPHRASRDQLFGERSHGFTRWAGAKTELDERSGVVGWVVHDLRRSVATHMADQLAVQPHIVEEVLGHATFKGGVQGRYNKATYGNEVRNALLAWHDRVHTLVAGGERRIVPFPPPDAA